MRTMNDAGWNQWRSADHIKTSHLKPRDSLESAGKQTQQKTEAHAVLYGDTFSHTTQETGYKQTQCQHHMKTMHSLTTTKYSIFRSILDR